VGVDEPLKSTTADSAGEAGPDDDLPTGNHALEVAARSGFGPLSAAAKTVWHGHAVPCVTCGQLVRRGAAGCGHCGQDLAEGMIEKMRAHAGPWFVLEHLRPFPGVSLDRIVRQIRRGLITETSIVRGPATEYQWRFAVETPGLCRFFGRCWHCYHAVQASDVYCAACLSHLSFERPRVGAGAVESVAPTGVPPRAMRDTNVAPTPPVPAPLPGSAELEKLASAVRSLDAVPPSAEWDRSPRIGPFRASWVAVGVIVIAVAALLVIVGSRRTSSSSPAKQLVS